MMSFFFFLNYSNANEDLISYLVAVLGWGKLFSQLFSLEMDVVGPRMSCLLDPGVSGGQGKLEGEGCCRGMLLRRNATVGGMPRPSGCRSMGDAG